MEIIKSPILSLKEINAKTIILPLETIKKIDALLVKIKQNKNEK